MISQASNVYIVSYAPATCGNFVSLVVWSLLEHPEGFHIFSKHGNAHMYNPYRENWDIPRHSNEWKKYIKDNYSHHLYKLTKHLNEDKPLIISSHKIPIFDEVFDMYPNAKLIIIQYDFKDIEYIKRLFYYKVTIDTKRITNTYEECVVDSEFEIPNNVSKFKNIEIPEIYKDKICIIKFRDILNEDSEFLETLGKFVNREVTDGIKKMHRTYLDKQPIDISFAKIST